jgi:hypothetical protein
MMAQGGTSTTTSQTVVVSDSTTNEFIIVRSNVPTLTLAGGATVTFATAFTATPTVALGYQIGPALSLTNYVGTVSPTTVGLTVSGMPTATVKSLDFIVYGTQRSGILE